MVRLESWESKFNIVRMINTKMEVFVGLRKFVRSRQLVLNFTKDMLLRS